MGGQRVRGLFAIVGGSAVAVAAAVIVVISPVPERGGQNGCALIPSIQGCTPPLNSGNSFPSTGNVTLTSVIPQDTVNALPTR
jgi:hypothetical protein